MASAFPFANQSVNEESVIEIGTLPSVSKIEHLEFEELHSYNQEYLAFLDDQNNLKICLNALGIVNNVYKNLLKVQNLCRQKFTSISFHPTQKDTIACLDIDKKHVHLYQIDEDEISDSGLKLKFLTKTKQLKDVKLFTWNPIDTSQILVVSDSNKITIWMHLKNRYIEESIDAPIKNAVWSYSGKHILVSAKERIIIHNDELEKEIEFEESQNKTVLFLEENMLFCFDSKENRTAYSLYQLNLEVNNFFMLFTPNKFCNLFL